MMPKMTAATVKSTNSTAPALSHTFSLWSVIGQNAPRKQSTQSTRKYGIPSSVTYLLIWRYGRSWNVQETQIHFLEGAFLIIGCFSRSKTGSLRPRETTAKPALEAFVLRGHLQIYSPETRCYGNQLV